TLRARSSPSALHAAALLELTTPGASTRAVDRAIGYLRSARAVAGPSEALLVDLSAALLARAERAQRVDDLIEAMEVASEAIALDPSRPGGYFNRALAEEHLGLHELAAEDWARVARVEPDAAWRDEAAVRARHARHTSGSTDAPSEDVASYRRLAMRAPQDAGQLAWDSLLPRWGREVDAGSLARAERTLALVDAIASALADAGHDATLRDAVRAIGPRPWPAAVRARARDHAAFGAARAAYVDGDYAAAMAAFGPLAEARTRGADDPLLRWSRLFWGATVVYAGDLARGRAVIAAVAAGADARREPALAGRAHWMLGTTDLRAGRYEDALRSYRTAQRQLATAGEREHVGAVQALAAEAEFNLGDARGALWSMREAMRTLAPYARSVWLHNALYAMAKTAAANGRMHAALRIQEADVATAERIGRPVYRLEAGVVRARLQTAAGRLQEARTSLRTARGLLCRLDPPERRWFAAHIGEVEAELRRPRDPAGAAAQLDTAVAFFASSGNSLRLLPALVARAEARLATGDVDGARGDLDRAVDELARQRAAVARAEYRVSLLDGARRVVDRLTMLDLARHDTVGALRTLEHGRTSLAATGGTWTRGAPRAPRGRTVLDYALVGDTLLTWVVRDAGVRLARTVVPQSELRTVTSRVRAALTRRSGDAENGADLARLHRWLIAPVAAHLGPADTRLIVIADGEIADVPFAALRDGAGGRHLVESHPLQFAASLDEALRARAPERSVQPSRVLLVADPAFDEAALPGLERLPGARDEVARVRALYPAARQLAGLAASRTALARALPGASLVHFAGHAVVDDDDPTRSYLVTAPDSGAVGRTVLTATELAGLDLRSVRLVVLSACEALQPRPGHASGVAGVAGIAGSLLSAGVGQVVGSDWPVDDQLTGRLMAEFHRAYRSTGDGARALRAAQLHLLRSDDPALRTPGSWAAFRVVGG
ncbi:MAG: CHAT domain-containing protein, partial [Gemmatirosa sp.]